MSILIKGMEMPTNCFYCPLSVLSGERLFCEVTKDEVVRAKRPSDCPLVPVAPHGRLGDLDALAQLFKEKANEHGGIGGIMVAMAAGCIDAAPTIIPAEPLTEET